MTLLEPSTSLVGSRRLSKWFSMYCICPCLFWLSQASSLGASCSKNPALLIPQDIKPRRFAWSLIKAVCWCFEVIAMLFYFLALLNKNKRIFATLISRQIIKTILLEWGPLLFLNEYRQPELPLALLECA